ncbi:MAG: ArgE/DapE family deacylase [Anaerolineae bacterium]|nr:ArgE/DapE family deacylase [Anaerolineae bacterium]
MIRKVDLAVFDRVAYELVNDEIVRFTQEFVRINSVNPNLAPGADESQAAGFIASACDKAGLQVQLTEIASDRPNVVCTLPGKTDRIGLLFLGHTDTVPFLGMENPLSGEVSGNYLWGRGSVDMKGGVAAAVQAVLALARAGVELEKGVAVAVTIDEESEHRGAFALAQQGFHADYCIVPEPSANQILLGCKGTAPIRIDVAGILAHASNPWLGVSAIQKAANLISELYAMPMKEFTVSELGLTLRGTMNVGVIQGGTAYNNVADKCSLYLDRRMVPGETQESCLAEVRSVLSALTTNDPQFRAMAETSRPDWHWQPIMQRGLNPAFTSGSSPIAQAVRFAHQEICGEPAVFGYTNGYMDMDFMVNDLGIPSINYGPGEPGMSHTAHERLRIDQLVTATRVFALAALQLAL